LIRYSTSN